MRLIRTVAPLTLASLTLSVAVANDADALFPLPAEVRTIIDNRCVMCHGEVIDGEAEIREDLIMITDEEFRDTLADPLTLYEMIRDDEMPQEARLSFRLRRQTEMRDRLRKLQEDYETNGEKAVLIAWLEKALKINE